MIDHFDKHYCFHWHPIKEQLRKHFMKIGSHCHLPLIEKNIVYMYPNIISFSFLGYVLKKGIKCHDFSSISNNDIAKFDLECNGNEKIDYLGFITNLIIAMCALEDQSGIKINFVIDIRKLRVVDQTLVKSIIELFASSGIKIVVLANEDLGNLLTGETCINNCTKYFSISSFNEGIESYMKKNENSFTLNISGRLSLKSFEKILNDHLFSEKIKGKLLIRINMEDMSSISIFALNLLNIFIFNTSKTFGILWEIEKFPYRKKINNLLEEYRFYEINKFLFINHFEKKINEDVGRIFGTRIFKEENQCYKCMKSFEYYLQGIYEMYPDHLGEYMNVSYDHDKNSNKNTIPRKYFLPRNVFIKQTVIELIENIMMHSCGFGYLSAEVSNYVLRIFIGDSGIGLKNGILKKYSIDNMIKNSQDALLYSFQLPAYTSKRNEDYEFNQGGAGFGLADCLANIHSLSGKLACRSFDFMGTFMNPSVLTYIPKTFSVLSIEGTHLLIMVPLNKNAFINMPRSTNDLLEE